MKHHACPCCGKLTLKSEPPGSYELCPVCYWEDDGVQFADPEYEGGANRESLNVARVNYRAFGASSRSALSHVRRPLPEEEPSAR
jgi:Cysteine-rich CPCC